METISGVHDTADPRQMALWGAQTGDGAAQTGAQPRSGRSEAEASGGGGEADSGQAPAHGLVIYAKTGRSCLGDSVGEVPDTPEMAPVLGFRFPSAADVADAGLAAELVLRGDVSARSRVARTGSGVVGFDRRAGAIGVIDGVVRSTSDRDGRAVFGGTGESPLGGRFASDVRALDVAAREGLTFSLRIASGAVTLSATNPDRSARRAEEEAARSYAESALSQRLAEWVGDQCPTGLARGSWWAGLDDEAKQSLMRAGASAVGAAHLADRHDSDREVIEWTRKSRANMVKALAELDYSPISGKLPVMVTLTYPRCWLPVAPDGAAVKAHLKSFRKRFERRYGPLSALWKLEFQGRHVGSRCACGACVDRDDGRAPHVHLWLPRPQIQLVRRRGKAPVVVAETAQGFASWLSAAWADIVGHPDVEQRMLHERAGTAVDLAAGLRGSDPKRLAIYFSKHGDAGGLSKEYQHVVPEAWRGAGDGPGRFWGYWRLERVAASVTLSPEDFVQAKRILRRWSRSRASYRPGERFPSTVFPATARRRVRRGDGWRWSTSRRQLFDHAGMTGGFACTNSGVALSISVVRAMRPEFDCAPPYWVRSEFRRTW